MGLVPDEFQNRLQGRIATHRAIFILIAVITLLRLFYAAALGLGDDEAYYWEWSRAPALSYLDHPPMVAWLGVLFSWLPGPAHVVFRFATIACSVGYTILVYKLALLLFHSTAVGFSAALMVSVMPLFAVGGFLVAPDTPLALFWAGAVYSVALVIFRDRSHAWYGAGFCFGLGLLSKYNMAALPLCVGLFLLCSRNHRVWLKRPHPWYALGMGLVMFLPVLLWNHRHGYPSFAYHLIERNRAGLSWRPLQLFLSGQLGYFSPLAFVGCVAAIVLTGMRGLRKNETVMLFLFCMALPYILPFSVACSLSPTTKPHWPALGYTTMFIACAALFHQWRESDSHRLRQWASRGWAWTIGTAAVMSGALLIQALYPVSQKMLPLVRTIAPDAQVKPRHDVTNDLYGWDEAGAIIASAAEEMERFGSYRIAGPRYTIASHVAFSTPGHPPVYSITHFPEQHDIWGRGTLDDCEGCNVLFVADNRYNKHPSSIGRFERVEPLDTLVTYRYGVVSRRFFLYRCFTYLGPPD